MMAQFYESFDYTILDDEELQELAKDISESLRDETPIPLIMSCLKSDPKTFGSQLRKAVTDLKRRTSRSQ